MRLLPNAASVEVGDAVLGRGSGAVVKRGIWRGEAVASASGAAVN